MPRLKRERSVSESEYDSAASSDEVPKVAKPVVIKEKKKKESSKTDSEAPKRKVTRKKKTADPEEQERQFLLSCEAIITKAPEKPKKYTEEEEEWAKGASMERNKLWSDVLKYAYKQIGDFVADPEATSEQIKKEAKAFSFKKANAKKAYGIVYNIPVPLKIPRELSYYKGLGDSTVHKIEEFLRGHFEYDPKHDDSALSEYKTEKDADVDPEYEWVADAERDVIIEAIKSGELKYKIVSKIRSDISESDVA